MTFSFNHFFVIVGEKPSVIQSLESVMSVKGQDVTLKCKIDPGEPPAKLYWYKDSHEIYRDMKHETSCVDDVVTLLIRDVDLSDAGNYTCEASNKLGRVDTSALLTIRGNI